MLAREAQRPGGGCAAVLIIDDPELITQGRHVVGVARQDRGQLGSGPTARPWWSLTLARGEVPVPVARVVYHASRHRDAAEDGDAVIYEEIDDVPRSRGSGA
jgi:hypothetical protein